MTRVDAGKSSPRLGAQGDSSRGFFGGRIARNVLTIPVLIIVIVIVAVLVQVVVHSFQVQTGLLSSAASLENYAQVFASNMATSFLDSFGFGIASALAATLIGLVISWTLTRIATPAARLFEVLAYVPFFLSTVIIATAWTYIASPQTGLVSRLMSGLGLPPLDIYTPGGIIWVQAIANVPLVVILCTSSFRQMDSSLEQASRTSGAGPVMTALRITLPLSMPAIISSLILTFMFSVEDFGAPYVLGHPRGIDTLSISIYDSIQASFPPNYNFAAAVGVVMMIITSLCFYLQQRYIRKRSFVTITGKASSQELKKTGAGRWVAFAINLVYALIVVVLPLLVLVAVGLSRNWTGSFDFSGLTTAQYASILTPGSDELDSLGNSLLLSVVTASVVIVLALLVVFVLQRTRVRGAHWMSVVLSIPVAVPGTVVAVGVLDWLLKTPLYATLGIIAIAYAVRFFPYGMNTLSSALGAVHPELEEASYASGVGKLGTLRKVLVPLLRPAIVSGWLLLFMIFMREVSISTLLFAPSTKTLSVELINTILYDPAGSAAAFASLQVLIILIPAVIVMRLTGGGGLSAFK